MRLLSIHRLSSAVRLAEHHHDCHQLLYVVRGEIEVTVESNRYEMRDGSLLILSRFESHAIRVISRDCERYTLTVSPEPSSFGTSEHDVLPTVLVNRSAQFCHVVELGRRVVMFERLLSMLTDEFRSRSSMREEMLELYGGGNRIAEKRDPSIITGHASMVENMLDAVINGTDPQILPMEAIKSVRIVNAIYESARTGKTIYFD